MPPATDRIGNLAFGDFVLVPRDERLVGPSGPVRLGNKAFSVLLLLARREGGLVTKDELFETVWDGTFVSESALTTVVKELRRALGDDSTHPRYIESVYGRGYRFVAPVAPADGEAPASAPLSPANPAEPVDPVGDPPLLAVPPFDDSALDAPHLGAVLREEVLLALARFRDIRLVSEAAPNARDGGWGDRDYQLHVRLIGQSGAVRAFARIARLSTQAIIWADQIPLDPDDLGSSVEELVRRVAAAALPRLYDDVLRNVPQRAGDLYGRYFRLRQRMRGLESLDEARAVAAEWEALIAEAPDFTLAIPQLIRLYNTDFCYTGLGGAGPEERARAYRLSQRAVAVEPTDSHLHSAKAWCHIWAGEPALAQAHLGEALDLNPWNQSRLIEVATACLFLGELDRAAALLDRCRRLTAVATETPHEEQGLLQLLRGDYDAAGAELALAGRIHPDDRAGIRPGILSMLYALLAAAGRDSTDLGERARAWRGTAEACWAGERPPGDEDLVGWALFHNPFIEAERREMLARLLRKALAAGTAGQARAGTPSPRRRAGPAAS